MAAILEVDRIAKVFGGLHAVQDVSFEVGEAEIVSMIGPNGAGKTTAFNCITGLYPLTSGDIRFRGQSIKGKPPHKITRLGITRTFQNIRLFSFMTAVDNVMVGEHCRMHAKVWDAVIRTPSERREEREVEKRALDILRRLGHRALRGRLRAQPPLRAAAPPGDRPRARQRPEPAPPRRARRRPQPAREARADGA